MSHSLRGLCGLKCSWIWNNATRPKLSQSARTVWIEIEYTAEPQVMLNSHSLRGLCGLKFLMLDRLTAEQYIVTVCEDCVD